MSEMVDADRRRRLFEASEVDEFMRGIEAATEETDPKPNRRLKLRSRLRLALYSVGGIMLGTFLLTRSGVDALTLIPLFAVWVFLGIPACCRLER